MHDLKSPYKHLGETRACFPTRVDPVDLAYVRKKFPYGLTGVVDTISATLFYKFVNELRKYEPFEPACFVNDPGYDILKRVLDSVFVERCTLGSGDQTSETGPRDGRCGTSSVCSEMRDAEVVQPVKTRGRKGGKKTKGSDQT